MKEAAIHRAVTEHADGAGIAVRQDRLGAILVADLLQARSDCVESLVPRDTFKALVLAAAWQWPLRCARLTFQGKENALRRVDTIEILGHLAAEKALRHRLSRISLNLDSAPFLAHRHQNCARIRAVMRANGVDDTEGLHGFIEIRL